MPNVPHPGQSEIGFLSDIRAAAERVGKEVLGSAVRWEVESTLKKSRKRPDVIIRWDSTGEVIANGEAKRPDDPDGVHCLVSSEVTGALTKARSLGSPLTFTTNLFEVALLEASSGQYGTDLDRVVGAPIPLVPERLATGPDWWSHLTTSQRETDVEPGLRDFFERIRAARTKKHISADINEIALVIFRRTTDQLVADLTPILLDQQSRLAVPRDVSDQGKQAHLNDLGNANDARYLCAQAVAEVLTASLFYRNTTAAFSLNPLLAGQNPSTPSALLKRVVASLDAAMNLTGDYETIFQLSPAAQWAIAVDSGPVLTQWKQLFAVLEQINFDDVTGDVIGSIFERLISPERRRDMGQHYTQVRIARAATAWAVRKGTDVVGDISCGAGTFLVEAYHALHEFGLNHVDILKQVIGNDLDPFAVHLATVNLATRDVFKGHNFPAVRAGDAVDLSRDTVIVDVTPNHGDAYALHFPKDGLDACVGNPPYDDKATAPEQFVQTIVKSGGTDALPNDMKNGNLAAWFFLLTAALTTAEGRIALVLPAGVLQNENLLPFRTWLRSRYDLTIWHTEDDVWFSDARVAPIVLLAERKADVKAAYGTVNFVEIHEPVTGEVSYRKAVAVPAQQATVRDLSSEPAEADLLIAGTVPDPLVEFSQLAGTADLCDIDGIEAFSGNKLGHAAYKLTDRAPDHPGLLRSVRGHAMDFQLHKKYLVPLLSGPRDERTGEFDPAKVKVWALNAPATLPSGGSLQQYVRDLRKLKVHEQPSVRQRGGSWWSVDWRTSNIAVQIHPGFEHQVWWCDEPFVANNNFHVVAAATAVSMAERELISASMSSAFGALSALYISSEVGCEGVRWLQTTQLDRWPVLVPSQVTADHAAEIVAAYRTYRKREAKKLHQLGRAAEDEFLALTAAVARAAGASDPERLAGEAVRCCAATTARRARREQIALAGRTRAGGGGGGAIRRKVKQYVIDLAETGPLIAAMTEGPTEFDLRLPGDHFQEGFDLGLALGLPATLTPEEQQLAELLGEGFHAAPILDAETVTLARTVRDAVRKHFFDVDPDTEAADLPDTYADVITELDDAFRKTIGDEVTRRLN